MRLQCAVCKRKPDAGERYVVISSGVHHAGGVSQGISLMVCQGHIPQEMTHALLLDSQIFIDDQAFIEGRIYGREG